MTIRTPRCLLFVPAHVERMMSKAHTLQVDALVLDLEDAVPPAEKAHARNAAARFASAHPGRAVVRLNPLTASTPYSMACGAVDIEQAVVDGTRGVILPKVEHADDVERCETMLSRHERHLALEPGTIELYAIVETAKGVLAAEAIARARVRRPYRLCFGAGDFTTDIGVAWTRDEEESRVARSLVVMASRAAGLAPPIDSVFADIADHDGLVDSAAMAKRLGFWGKFAIHPSQVQAITQAFTPDADQVAWATEVLDGLKAAEAKGEGAFIVRGKMIDYPIVEQARRLLERWQDVQQSAA